MPASHPPPRGLRLQASTGRVECRVLLTLAAFAALLPASGCSANRSLRGLSVAERPLLPNAIQTKTGPFVLHTHEPISNRDPSSALLWQAVAQLGSLPNDLNRDLQVALPRDLKPIDVYVLTDRKTYDHYLSYYFHGLPHRRAFFLARDDRRVVYTYQGDNPRIVEDLRHEGTHALLHAGLGPLPLWLDEGLAEYYEPDHRLRGPHGEHRAWLEALASSSTDHPPDLTRLETMPNAGVMTSEDYAQSWAWVAYLLNGPPEVRAEFHAYLADLASGADAPELSQRLAQLDPAVVRPEQFARTLEAWRDKQVRVARAEPSPTSRTLARFQNEPATPTRRGLLGWFASIFGGRDRR